MSVDTNLAKQFLAELAKLQAEKGAGMDVDDIDALLNQVKSDERDRLYSGIQEIASRIGEVKVQLSESPDDILQNKIPDANEELSAVIKATEEATNNIMDAAELINEIAEKCPDAEKEAIQAKITDIFEASNFQDITGQRIQKVVNTLVDIDGIVDELMCAISGHITIHAVGKKAKTAEEELLNGPQMEQNKPSQDDIDKLFEEAN